MPKYRYVCSECKSSALVYDANAVWNEELQQMVLSDYFSKPIWCSNCEGETTELEIQLEDNAMQEDYPELEGKEIVVRNTPFGDDHLIVAGCNRAIGCTLVVRDNKTVERFCFNRKEAHTVRGMDDGSEERWNEVFDWVVDAIKAGGFCYEEYKKLMYRGEEPNLMTQALGSHVSCAFK